MKTLPPAILKIIARYLNSDLLIHTSQAHPDLFYAFAEEIDNRRLSIEGRAREVFHPLHNTKITEQLPLSKIIQFGYRYPTVNLLDFMKEIKGLRLEDKNNAALALIKMIDPQHPARPNLPRFHEAVLSRKHQLISPFQIALFMCLIYMPMWYQSLALNARQIFGPPQKKTTNLEYNVAYYVLSMLCFSLQCWYQANNPSNTDEIQTLRHSIAQFNPTNKQEKEYLAVLRAAYQDITEIFSHSLITDLQGKKIIERGLALGTFVLTIPHLLYLSLLLFPWLIMAAGSPFMYWDKEGVCPFRPLRLDRVMRESIRCLPALECYFLLIVRLALYALVVIETARLAKDASLAQQFTYCMDEDCSHPSFDISVGLIMGSIVTVVTTYLYECARPQLGQCVENTLHHAYRRLRAPLQPILANEEDIEAANRHRAD